MGQGKGREKVDDVGPLDCLPDDGLVHLGEGHALGTDQIIENRDILLFQQIGPLAGGQKFRFPEAQHPDLMAVLPEDLGKAPGGDGHAVVGRIELVGHQKNFHGCLGHGGCSSLESNMLY